jgi:hypothetical protein
MQVFRFSLPAFLLTLKFVHVGPNNQVKIGCRNIHFKDARPKAMGCN